MSSTETVTILFTDMVGSTALSQRLEPTVADDLRERHFSFLRQALAATEGREVKNLGDGLMAVFTSPSAAVACGVAMQQFVEQDNRRSAHPLGLRVAMSGGEVTVQDDDYFGDPVVEAARLCGICEGGQIMVSDLVRSMAGRRNPHRFTSLGERELKGLPEPFSVYEVVWEPVAITAGIPLPDRLATAGAGLFGYFGRHQEQVLLADAVKNTIEGHRQVAFLSGEPGIGKTSLCREVAKVAHESGVSVLYGRCDEDLGVSYQPFAQALGHLVVHAEEEQLATHVVDHGGGLVGLVPALLRRIPDLPETRSADPESERLQLFSAVIGLLALASSEAGLLLVLDDLQWADKTSLQLLRHVAGSDHLAKVMVLGTYRSSELSAGNALSDTLASLRREVDAVRLDLVGLEDLEIIEMMERVAGHDMDEEGIDLAHRVRRETDGNPFFATEMLRHLAESGLVHQDENGRWVASDNLYEKGLPQSVREVVGQRVDRLGEEVRPVLSQAAVIGRDFDLNLLSRVADIDEDRLLDLVDRTVEAGLVIEVEGMVERFSFAHALTQHTLYEDLGATRRARVHRKIAEALEELCGNAPESRAGELAHHFVAATKTADAVKALSYTKMAGEQALANLAPADALGWFDQALDLFDQAGSDESTKCDLLIGLGTAQRETGDASHRETLLMAAELALNLHDTERLVRAALSNNRGSDSITGAVDEERVNALESALALLGETDSRERALLLATLASEIHFGGDWPRTKAVGAEALAIARRLGDPAVLLRTINSLHWALLAPDTLRQRLDLSKEALELCPEVGDPLATFHAYQWRAADCWEVGDFVQVDRCHDAADQLADQLDQPFLRWSVKMRQSCRSLLAGELEKSESFSNEALSIGDEGSVPEALTVWGSQLMTIRTAQGRVEEVIDLFSQAAADNPDLPVLDVALARLYCEIGQLDNARAVFAPHIAAQFSRHKKDGIWLSAMCVCAEVSARLGEVEASAIVYNFLAPFHAQIVFVDAASEGSVSHFLGVLAATLRRYEQAESHFSEALSLYKSIGAPYLQARLQLEWAEMLVARRHDGDVDHGMTLVADASDLAHELGFEGLSRRAARISKLDR